MRPKMIYYYRGSIERGVRYTWRDGYSRSTDSGSVLYPWMTRRECKSEAKTLGAQAVFYRDGKPL